MHYLFQSRQKGGKTMQKQICINAFTAMKLEKQVRIAKGKQDLLRHFERLRSEKRKLDNAPIITTIW